MSSKNKKAFWLLGVLLVGVITATATYMLANQSPQRKPGMLLEAAQATMQPKVTKNTILRVEYTYLCGNKENSETNVTPDLLGLGLNQLTQRFSREDGWIVSGELPARLLLQKEEWDVCPVHRNYRHLGMSNGYLAIFEGPLGVDNTLLQKEDIKVANLPKELQEQLAIAARYKGQSTDRQRQLRENLEFAGDEQINTFLDNLDEYRAE